MDMQSFKKLSNGLVKVAAGAMYGAIENLSKLNWIEEIPSRDSRRRVYQITNIREEILMLKTEQLRNLVQLSSNLGY